MFQSEIEDDQNEEKLEGLPSEPFEIGKEGRVLEEQQGGIEEERDNKIGMKAKGVKHKWGHVMAERRSKRNPQDGISVQEKSKAQKIKDNLEKMDVRIRGKKSKTSSSLSNANMRVVASKVGLKIGNTRENESDVVDNMKKSI